MPSSVSQDAKNELLAQESGEAFLMFITISGEDLAAPLRFVHNTQPVVSGTYSYEPAKFEMPIPSGNVGNSTRLKISISNVDRQGVNAVRSVSVRHPLSLTGFVARASDPDTIEQGPFTFTLRAVEWDASSLSGDLHDDLGGEVSVPKVIIGPASFPGLY